MYLANGGLHVTPMRRPRADVDGEIVLSTDKSVSRSGGVVLRPSGPWSPAVLALLRHLESVGFTEAPRVVEPGLSADGREMVTFLEGQFVHPKAWSDPAIVEVGRMLRRLHDATATFAPPPGSAWKSWFLRDIGGATPVYGHGDIAPWNMITKAGMPLALVDWEYAGPIDPLSELARVCWLFPQLHDDDVGRMQDLPSPATRARQVRLLVDAYGAAAEQRRQLFDRILEVTVRETAQEAIDANVTLESAGVLWGLAWRARAAGWMLRHRDTLEGALR